MPVIDRMEFPRKYKLKDSLLILALLAIGFGIWLNNSSQRKITEQVLISDVVIENSGSQFIELSYQVENRLSKVQELRILVRVYDTKGAELASAMYMAEFPAKSLQRYTKMLDKLNRSLEEGEIPARAEVSIYTRKVF